MKQSPIVQICEEGEGEEEVVGIVGQKVGKEEKVGWKVCIGGWTQVGVGSGRAPRLPAISSGGEAE